jgi:hypothetical protein
MDNRPEAIWKYDSSPSGAYTNYSSYVRSNTDIPFVGTNTQYYYIGCARRFTGLCVDLATNGSYTGLTYEYYDGTAWATLSLIDSYIFSESKYQRWVMPDQWQKYRLTDEEPHAGIDPPDDIERYWVRISATAVTTAAVIDKIRVMLYASYSSPTKVSELLQFKKDFDHSTVPSELTIEDLIRRAEDRIDYLTTKSWKINVVENELVPYNRYGLFPRFKNISKVYGVAIWNGGEFAALTEGRNNDYFVDYDRGMIYFTRLFLLPAAYGISGRYFHFGFGEYAYSCQLNYAYGKDPEKDMQYKVAEDVATKMAAVDILKHHDYSSMVVSGSDHVSLDSKINILTQEIENRIEELKGISLW